MGSNGLAFSPSIAPTAPDFDTALTEALSLSSKARQLDARGSHTEAEQLLHRALALVEPRAPRADSTVAALWNSLGELYLHMGRLDDAERWFAKSLDASMAAREFREITATRENLARVAKARSELLKAQALRMLGAPDDMRCNRCRKGLLRTPDLRICGGCKGAFYCSNDCQRSDWERHHRKCGSAHSQDTMMF